jgi:hypothetical protein
MSYTNEEVTAAVEQIVRSSIRREYGALGNRRTDLTFGDLQDAAAGVFTLKLKAPLYVVRLAVERLIKRLETSLEAVSNFIGVVEGTGRHVTPVDSLSPLANARSALSAMSLAVEARTSPLARVEDNPAYQRFITNTQRFLDESSKNIRSGGELVRTPEEARAMLGTSFTEVQQEYEEVIRLAGLLASAMEDYESMSLPATLSSNVISNSRNLLSARYEALAALTPQDRLSELRDTTLEILTARATIKGFGSFAGPTLFYIIDGSAVPFADATHPAAPARLTADYNGPYPITDTEYELHIEVEGDSLTIPIQGSFIAKLETVITAPYDVTAANDELRITLDNYPSVGSSTTWDVPITNSGSLPIWTLVSDINTVVDPTTNPLIAEPYLQPRKWVGTVDITVGGTADVQLTATNPSLDFTDLDGAGLAIETGDLIIIRDSASPNDEYILDVVLVTSSVLDCGWDHPGMPTYPDLGVEVEIGGGLALRLRITQEADDNGFVGAVDYQLQALEDRVAILIPATNSVSEDDQYDTATTFGLFPRMEVRSAPTSAKNVAESMNKSVLNNTYSGGVATPRVNVGYYLNAFAYVGGGRTNPLDFTQVICTKFRGIGNVTGGTSVTFIVAGAASAGAVVGDVAVLRTSSTTSDVNAWGLITLVDDTQIQVASMSSSITADTGIEVEVGPDLTSLGFDGTVRVEGTTGNEGSYQVTAVGAIPCELTIDNTMTFPNGTGNAPVEFDVQVGKYRVYFESADTSLDSLIAMDSAGSAFSRFFSSSPMEAPGYTPYIQLPEWPAGIEEGDFFETYTTLVGKPASVDIVQSLEKSSLLIELSDPFAVNYGPIVMTAGSPLPFARIRRHGFDTYNTLKRDLDGWLAVNDPDLFFRGLRTRINPLAANKKPTAAQVGAAVTSLEGLYTALQVLGVYLLDYEADVVPEVDTLIQSFQEKGADRAVDLLLEARFSDFFGLDQDEVSYAGTMQKSIRTVSREDLPVRKDNRNSGTQVDENILATYDDKDFEFAADEVDNDIDIDLPGG